MKLSQRRGLRGTSSLALDLTSMIDVVFLLLIFFMINIRFHETERDLQPTIQDPNQQTARAVQDLEPVVIKFSPPAAAGGAAAEPGIAAPPASWGFVLGAQTLTSQSALTEMLKQFPNLEDGAFVQIADEVPFALVAAALQAGHDAGFTKISLLPASGPRAQMPTP